METEEEQRLRIERETKEWLLQRPKYNLYCGICGKFHSQYYRMREVIHAECYEERERNNAQKGK